MPTVNRPPPPGMTGTFAQWRDWANSRSPGAGDQFITWVQQNANVPPPYAFNLSSDAYGPTGLGDHNYAENYFGAWLLFGQLGPGIAQALAGGITAGGKLIPKALTGFAKAIGELPGAQQLGALAAIADFVGRLDQAATWERLALVGLGVILLAVGVAKATNAVPVATKIAKKVGAVGLAAA